MTILGQDKLKMYLATRVPRSDENLAQPVVAAIKSARRSVCLATQQLEDKKIVDALVAAKQRGCQVRVLLETDYLIESPGVSKPWTPQGENEANRGVLAALLRSNIPTRLDRQSTLFHSNFVVCDAGAKQPMAVVSSANMTPMCARTHWNASLVMADPVAAKSFDNEFNLMWESSGALLENAGNSKPPETKISKLAVKIVFGPRHQPEMEVMKQIAKAKKQVRFAMYTFSQTSGIDDVLALAASRAGIDVAGVLDEQIHNQKWVAAHGLEKAGVKVAWLGNEIQKMHHKLLTVDDKVAIVGTFNFTGAARFSHETIVVIGSADTDSPLQSAFVNGVAEEIDRLIGAGRHD